ncbi:hypothetical protein GCM10022393_19760 [Aquimarina addita]|uniref:Conjugal transfer protein TraG n=2 Tax=Aquimarina addita TaxID=870485 RepID=A0ABP6UKQ9_9FLAO
MNKINLSAYHPILDIKDHTIFANNGNVILGYKVDFPEIYSLSENDFEDMHGAWFQAFKSLPVSAIIHKQDIYQKTAYNAKTIPNDSFLAKATNTYFKGREYTEHTSYLFFVLPINKALNASKFTNPFRKVEKGIHKKLDHNVTEFIASVNDAISFINNSRKVSLKPLNEDAIIKLTNNYFNGFNEGFDTDIQLKKSNIEIGENYFDVLAVNNELCFGDVVQSSKTNDKFTSDDFVFHQGFIDGLGLNLNENHIVNQIIYLDDKQKWRKLLDKKIEELNKSSNFGTQNKVILKKIKDIVAKINEDDSSRIIRGHLNIIFWCREAQQLSTIASKIKTESKLEAIDDLKEVRQTNAPSIYDERLLDSTGMYDPDLLDKQKMRIVDSIYNEGRISYSDRSFRKSETKVQLKAIRKDSLPQIEEKESSISSKELGLEHLLFFASHPIENESSVSQNTDAFIYVRVDGTQTVRTNYRLQMRLTKSALINNILIPKNAPIYGFVSFKPNRTIINIENINHRPVKLKAFDLQDGSEGIYVENSFRAEARQEVVSDIVDDINIVGVPQVSGIKQIFQRNNRTVKVTVTDNYKLILKPIL